MIDLIRAFRHMSKRHGAAVRRQDNMRATGGAEQRENALAAVQEVENEFAECFVMVKRPPSMGGAKC